MIPASIESTSFSWIGPRYAGKVRDCYSRGDVTVLIATDRLSAFDRVLTTVPRKGEVLTQMASFWFELCKGVVPNHCIAYPDPNVMVVQTVDILPVEVVVRGYLAGSAWRNYSSGIAPSGVDLPPGLSEFQKLQEPIVTPFTKEAAGKHDQPLSEVEVVGRGIVSPSQWSELREVALELFAIGTKEVARRGLLLVDTKYEFGLLGGKVVLADEVHTLDSSRFWVEESYLTRVARGEPPEMVDKEPVRRWLLERGFTGEGEPPRISDAERVMWMHHYMESYSRITGRTLELTDDEPLSRVEQNLKRYFAGKQEHVTDDR